MVTPGSSMASRRPLFRPSRSASAPASAATATPSSLRFSNYYYIIAIVSIDTTYVTIDIFGYYPTASVAHS